MAWGTLGIIGETLPPRFAHGVLLVFIMAGGLVGCSQARLPVPPDAKAHDYFREPLQRQLALAVERGDADGIAAAIKAGADVDKAGEQGIRPLMWALTKQNVQGFRYLLKHNANLMAKFEDPRRERRKIRSHTIAELVIRHPATAFLREMLENGFDPNTVVEPTTGETLLFLVVYARNYEGATILLDAGADANMRLRHGDVAITEALGMSDYKMANILYKRGANPELANEWGYSVARILKAHGDRYVTPDQRSEFDAFVDAMVERGLVPRQDIVDAGVAKPGDIPGVEIIEHRANSPVGRAILDMDAAERRANQKRP